MNLSDRLEQARRPVTEIGTVARDDSVDLFAELKARVHQALIDHLGPKLYDPTLSQADLEQRVRGTLQRGAGSATHAADGCRPGADRPGDRRRHPRLRTHRALPARPGHQRDHGQRPGPDLRRAVRRSTRSTRTSPTPPTCGGPSTRSSAGRPARRRVQPDGRRAPARRQPGQRRHPPARVDGSLLTIRKFAADPFTVDDLIAFGTDVNAGRRVPRRACVTGKLNILVSGGTGSRQDDHAQRAVASSRPTSASSPSRTPPSSSSTSRTCSPGVAPAEHRGAGRGHHPRPGAQLAAYAPDRIVVGEVAWRRGARHAPGDEHRPRRLDHHRARELAPRRPGPLETMVLMAGHGPARARDPRAVLARIDLIVHQARLATARAASPRSPRSSGWRGTVQELYTFTDGSAAGCTRPVCGRGSPTGSGDGARCPGAAAGRSAGRRGRIFRARCSPRCGRAGSGRTSSR
jgi:pilus assembly protein CpaF